MRSSLPWSGPLHFINTPDWLCNFAVNRDCPTNQCVHGAIQNYSARANDNRLPEQQHIEAIKFLTHFVGDIHQVRIYGLLIV